MKYKLFCLIGCFLIILFIFICNTFKTTASNQLLFNNVYQAKKMSVNGHTYITISGNDGIYFLNHEGNIVKKINFWSEISYDYYMISDIDKKGQDDIIIIYEDTLEKEDNIYTVSYEDSSIIWRLQTTMESNYYCSNNKLCKEDVVITDHLLKEKLYITAGYHFLEIDINDGIIKNQFQYTNNIWNFSFIHDINNDYVDDIVISVQPSDIIVLDGRNYEIINRLKVAKDLITQETTIKRNIWDLAYISNTQILLAASEDGYVYEINLNKNIIEQQIQIFNTEFSDVREYYLDESNLDGFASGFYNRGYKNMSFESVSIDNDNNIFYLINYNKKFYLESFEEKVHYSVCHNDECISSKATDSFISSHHSLFSYFEEYYNEGTISTKLVVKNMLSHDQLYTIEEISDIIDFYILDDLHSLIISNMSIKYISNNTLLWEKDKGTTQTTVIDDDLLTIIDKNRDNNTIGLHLYSDNDEIFNFSPLEGFIENYQIYGDTIYLSVNIDNKITIYVYSITTSSLLATKSLDEEALNITLKPYQDKDNDGILEYIVLSNTNKDISLLNIKSNEVLNQFELNSSVNIDNLKDLLIINDCNNDDLKDLMLIPHRVQNDSTFILIYSDETELFSQYHHLSIEIPLDHIDEGELEYQESVDLNHDGFREYIYNIISGYKKIFFIIDVANKKVIFDENLDYEIHVVTNEFINSHHDLNNDGIEDIISLIDNGEYQIFNILNYNNSNLTNIWSKNIDIIKKRYASPIATMDINDDNQKEIILYEYDINGNIRIMAYNSLSEQPIKTIDVKQSSNESFDEIRMTLGNDIDVIKLNDVFYIVLLIDHKYVFVNTKNWSISEEISHYQYVYHDKIIYLDDKNQVKFADLIDKTSVDINLYGLFKNIIEIDTDKSIGNYFVSINGEDFIQIFDKSQTFYLKPGMHQLIIKINTDEVDYFVYKEVNINDYTKLNNVVIISILVMNIVLFMIFTVLIRKKYYKTSELYYDFSKN